MSFRVDCMKSEPLFLRFVLVRDECFWQITARSLTFDFRKSKLMCYSSTFLKAKLPYFLSSAIMDSERFIISQFFQKNNTCFLLMPSTSPRYFVIHLKLTWSNFNFYIKKIVILIDGIMRTRLLKSAKIFRNMVSGSYARWLILWKLFFLSNTGWCVPRII